MAFWWGMLSALDNMGDPCDGYFQLHEVRDYCDYAYKYI